MEKFGIFNILSALSALSDKNGENAGNSTTASKETCEHIKEEEKTEREIKTGIFTGEERKNKMLEVLSRHEEISKRIDKKNIPR